VNRNSYNCPDELDSHLLLAYVEGDLSEEEAMDLEAHLEGCPTCSRSVKDLRDMHDLLKKSSGAFHPDSEQLWRFAVQTHDPGGIIAAHVEDCAQCREDAELLREMSVIGASLPERPPRMPASLRERLEELHGSGRSLKSDEGWIPRALERFRDVFRVPTLALGTSAALAILIVLSISVWRQGIQLPFSVEKTAPEQVAPVVGSGEGTLSAEEARLRGAPVSLEEALSPEKTDKLEITKRQYALPSRIPTGEEEGEKEKKRAAPPGIKLKERPPSGLAPESSRQDATGKPEERPPAPSAVSAKPRKEAVTREVVPLERERAERFQARLQPRMTVEVHIVDGEGEPIPWLKFTPRPDEADRYRFIERGEIGEAAPTVEGKPGAPQDLESVPSDKDRAQTQYLVVVEVRASGEGVYDLRARLLEHGVREMKSLAESAIRERDLARKVDNAVYTLLGTL